MRIALSVTFIVLAVILLACSIISFLSKKQIGKSVGLLILSLVPPVIGNLLIIASPIKELTTVGCYVYFLGMDVVMFAVFRFMFDYCNITFHKKLIKSIVYTILVLDAIQLILNIWLSHAFIVVPIKEFDGSFFTFEAFSGQLVHRIVDYVILGSVMLVFLIKTITSPKLYSEKYLVVFLAMVAVAIWQSVNIFTKTTINISMIGYGVFGVIIFVLTIFYRPLRLLGRMLGVIASKMPESIFFFDTNGKCIWINDKASALLKVTEEQLDDVPALLEDKLGDYQKDGNEWANNISFGSGDNVRSYVIEKHNVYDNHNHLVGSYLTIRDNSEEQKKLQRETYNASHDALTKILNRNGYEEAMKSNDVSKIFLLLIDLDSFKECNDNYGHTIGDKVLVNVASTIKKNFRNEDYVSRLGGDEFAVIITNVDKDITKDVSNRVKKINDELTHPEDDLPPISISSGGAYGKDAENAYELFNNADHAMYKTKFGGKKGFSLFEKR